MKNTQLADQLLPLRDQITAQKRVEIKNISKSPMLWMDDGVDHINIWEQAGTAIGKMITNNSKFPVNHKIFGKFCSIESFWHYIQSEERDDRIRVMSGVLLKQFSKKLTVTKVINFRAIILDTAWQRVKQHPGMMIGLKESILPFDCYYVSKTGLKTRPIFFKWLVMGYDEIREAIKENREPVFDFLLDKKHSDIYKFCNPVRTEMPATVSLTVPYGNPEDALRNVGLPLVKLLDDLEDFITSEEPTQ
jgi:hypothetical protein